MSPCWLYTIVIILHISCAEVVNTDFTQCNSFFYKGVPPSGFNTSILIRKLKRICQRYNNSYHYATLYSSDDKIRSPIYSAYTVDTLECPGKQPPRPQTWFIEPQVSGIQRPNMETEGTMSSIIKVNQSIKIDFKNTNFDKGHLNPSSYQCNYSRIATFTLTNAVPQDPCFNQQIWKQLEVESKRIMLNSCNFTGAKRYFVTGVVPSKNTIPKEYPDKEDDQIRDFDRVSVPSMMWTAACCDSSNAHNMSFRDQGFSYGYVGENRPESFVHSLTIDDLQLFLQSKLHTGRPLHIFHETCFSDSNKSKQAIKKLRILIERKVFKKTSEIIKSDDSSVSLRKRQVIDDVNYFQQTNYDTDMIDWNDSDVDVSISKSDDSSKPLRKRAVIEDVNYFQHTNYDTDMIDWTVSDVDVSIKSKPSDIQNIRKILSRRAMTTILVPTNQHGSDKYLHTYFDVQTSEIQSDRKGTLLDMNMVSSSDDISDTYNNMYKVVPSNPVYLTATLDQCRHDHPCDNYDRPYSWCYTDWSNNWDYCCVGECGRRSGTSYEWCTTSSMNEQWSYCSQRSSVQTVTGKRCRDDHECGTHNQNYYWCYTDKRNNWDYCCQPWHECNSHDLTYTWCYVGYREGTDSKLCMV